MVLRKAGQDPRGQRKFVVSLVPFLLLAVNRAQSEMQSGIPRIGSQGLVKVTLGFAEVLLACLRNGLQQSFGNGCAHPRGLGISRAQDAHQILVGARRLNLFQLTPRRQRCQPAFCDHADQAAARNPTRQPGSKLRRINGLRIGVSILGGLGDDSSRQTEQQ